MREAGRLLPTAAIFYGGLIVGVSFIATPVKFLAPTPTVAELLDIGRQTFRVFGWVEYAFAGALLAMAIRRANRAQIIITGAIALIVLTQHLGLRPPLDARVERIIAGETVPPSHLHRVYTIGAGVKLVLVLVLGFWRSSAPVSRHPADG